MSSRLSNLVRLVRVPGAGSGDGSGLSGRSGLSGSFWRWRVLSDQSVVALRRGALRAGDSVAVVGGSELGF